MSRQFYILYIFSIAVRPAVWKFVFLSPANRGYAGWLNDTVLKPARKLSLVVTFVLNKSAQPDQCAGRGRGQGAQET